jgi:hypothetical protein
MPDVKQALSDAASQLRSSRASVVAQIGSKPTARERNVLRREAKAMRKVALECEIALHDLDREDPIAAKREAHARISG